MAVIRQGNWLSQQRIDIPHVRSIESGVAADFDVLAGRAWAGGRSYVLRGFEMTGVVASGPATSLQLSVADGLVFNQQASESGTMLWVPSDRDVETLNPLTNELVLGGWIQSATNYVGIDYTRLADVTTTDLVQFEDALTGLESGRQVPLAQTLNYVIQISTVPFSAQSNIIPIAIVTLNGSAQIVSVEDARPMMFRLGSGGDNPEAQSFYADWTRKEGSSTVDNTAFTGGDKSILNLKDWQDAVMTRIWEIGGGENWYSAVADRNIHMSRDYADTRPETGDSFYFDGTDLFWSGLSIEFENANDTGVYYNTVDNQTTPLAGTTDIVAGECIYVDLDRTANTTVTAHKAVMQTLGSPSTPGARVIIAWCDANGICTRDSPFPVNTALIGNPATTTVLGSVKLQSTPGDAAEPLVPTFDINNTLQINPAGNPHAASGNNSAVQVTGNAGTGPAMLIAGGGAGSSLSLTGTGADELVVALPSAGFAGAYLGASSYNWRSVADKPALVVGNTYSGVAFARSAIFINDSTSQGIATEMRGYYPIAGRSNSVSGYSFLVGADSTTTGVTAGAAALITGGYATVGNANGGLGMTVVGGNGIGSGAPGKALTLVAGSGGTGNANCLTVTASGSGTGAVITGGASGKGAVITGLGSATGLDVQGGTAGGTGVSIIGGTAGTGAVIQGGAGARGIIVSGDHGSSGAIQIVQTGAGPAIEANGGNVQVATGYEFSYYPVRTHSFFVPITSLVVDPSGYALDLYTADPMYWRNSDTTGGVLIGGTFSVPQGASLTSVEFALGNSSGASADFIVKLRKHFYSTAGFSATTTMLTAGSVTIPVANGAQGWYSATIAAGAGVIFPSTTGTATDNGYVDTHITFPDVSVGSARCYGIKVTYTMPNLRPA